MRAMILAAGRGERLRPLTDVCPKPLLKVQGKALIEYHLEALKRAGIDEIVINVCYLADHFQKTLGTGKKWGVHIEYSIEDPVLETGGGINKALPLLSNNEGDSFIVLSGDIFTDFPFEMLINHKMPKDILAHLVLVDNPAYHTLGDFGLESNKLIKNKTYTYANMGVYKPKFFQNSPMGAFPLGLLLNQFVDQSLLTGEYYNGVWLNIGTLEELKKAQNEKVFT